MYYASARQMEKLDKMAVADGLEIRQMMELAGWRMVELYRLLKIKRSAQTAILVGKGNKGGDGLAAARHLVNHGYKVKVILVGANLKKDPRHHLRLLQKMAIDIARFSDKIKVKKILQESGILIDSLIGYHLRGNPRGDIAKAIDLINSSTARVISYDLPSGIDATTGECLESCIKADVTLTLALPKKVFQKKFALAYVGKVYLADIGIPEFLYKKIKPSLGSPFVGKEGIIRVI